jgi:aminoglycoside phosphotransferase (APT) family kinase protein
MLPEPMHVDEIPTSAVLVRRLLAGQFPQWADLPITPIASAGTDNALYRLGDDLAVRLPRLPGAAAQIDNEQRWLPWLAPRLPLAIPVPLGLGQPDHGYPWPWAVCRWLAGDDAAAAPPAGTHQAAADLARFVSALRQIPPDEDAPAGRGRRLAERDPDTRQALTALAGSLDTMAAAAAWDRCLRAPDWAGPPVWTHGDLIAPNLLVNGGRITAVIDFGCLGLGDPALDLIAAWSALTAGSRPLFRAALAVDEATWLRGQGWALSQALIIIPYYRTTNPGLTAVAQRMIAEILAEPV